MLLYVARATTSSVVAHKKSIKAYSEKLMTPVEPGRSSSPSSYASALEFDDVRLTMSVPQQPNDTRAPIKTQGVFKEAWQACFGTSSTPYTPPTSSRSPKDDMYGALVASAVNVGVFMPSFTMIIRTQTSGKPPLVVLGNILTESHGSTRKAMSTLYKGIGPAFVTVGLSRATTYGIMGKVKESLPKDWKPYQQDLASGVVASALKVLITQPPDIMKVMNQNGHHVSTRDFIKLTLAEQGILGFWRGGMISAAKSMGGTPLWITAKNQASRSIDEALGPVQTSTDKGARSFLAGFFASIAILPITYPLDASKSLVMAVKKESDQIKTIGIRDVIHEFRQGGASRIYRGAGLQVGTMVLGGAVFNTVQEAIAEKFAKQ